MSPPRELREYAETPDRYALLAPDVERYADDRLCILSSATFASVSGVTVRADEVADLVEEVRRRVPGRRPVWWIGPSTQPVDLHERLRALGFGEPADRAASLRTLLLVRPPPEVIGVEVRRVETVEDALSAAEVTWEAFDRTPEWRERERPHVTSSFLAQRASGNLSTFLALLEGRPAATGRSVRSPRGSFLIGGATLPWARGRGLYRALVRARWDEAVAGGTPALVTQALPDTSYPILLRLGFAELCRMRRLEDRRA